MRFVALVASIVLSGTLSTSTLVSTALAVTTVQSTSENSVGQDEMTVEKPNSSGTQLIDIAGFGRQEGCCSKSQTTFTPDPNLEDKNKTWPSHATKISDRPVYVSGIKLNSKPFDKKNEKDPYLANFDFVPLLNIGSSGCGKSNGQDDDCDEEEHEDYHNGHEGHHKKHKHHHKDHGGPHCYGSDCPDQGPPLTPTPLPAALPLMGSVLGGFGIAMWRRRRKQKSV